MNVVGFLLFCGFAALAFFLSHVMRKDDGAKPFSGCPTAVGTISGTCKAPDHDHMDDKRHGYQYMVEFRDQDGQNALGFSETFLQKRTLENGQIVTFYFRKPKQGKNSELLQRIVTEGMNTMTEAFFDRPYEPDPRPRYDIRFCDRRVYALEDKSTKNMARVAFLFGCVLLVLAVVILLK